MNRPKVVTINSASLDGRLAISPDALLLYGDPRWQAIETWGAPAPADTAYARLKAIHQPQATLEGSGSFVRPGAEPEPLPPFEGDPATLYRDFLPEAVVGRPDHQGWFAAVDGRGRVRQWIKDGGVFGEEWTGWHLLVLVAHHTPPEYLATLRGEVIPYLVAGEDGEHVDLGLALSKMQSELGITSLLSTAGGQLNGALLRAGLVDEVNVEFLPAVVGGFETPALFDGPVLAAGREPVRLELISADAPAGGRAWLRYRVVRQEGA